MIQIDAKKLTRKKAINKKIINKIAIVGLGLIGGSLAGALKKNKICKEVIGYSRREETLQQGLALGLIDQAASDFKSVMQADVVVLCTPLSVFPAMLQQLASCWREGVIFTDVGSAKYSVMEAAKTYLPRIQNFVPGHPIAGSEKSGVGASQPELFQGHSVILTPTFETSLEATELITQMWAGVGAQVFSMSIKEHDKILAATSHLPHFLAFSLVDTLAGDPENQEIFRYAAGGFRDFTRIAASDPLMWRDIFLANKSAVLDSLVQFKQGIDVLEQALRAEDDEHLLGVFTRAKVAREHFATVLARRSYLEGAKKMKTEENKEINYEVATGGCLNGDIRVPGDKSVSHRSIMLGSLAEGITEVEGFLEGEDALATLQAFRDMGVVIEGPHSGSLKIHGVGLYGLKSPPGPLYLGNSGTSMRLLAGLLSAQKFSSELTGDDSLSKRPMERIAGPLRSMGAKIKSGNSGRPPLVIEGQQCLKGKHYDMPMASAQVKSALLLAGLYAEGITSVTEPAPSRDHTERMLQALGYPVTVKDSTISVVGGGRLSAVSLEVPSDISSAAFFLVGASIAMGSNLWLRKVGLNPTRIGVINILKAMGANIELHNQQDLGGEPVADLHVQAAQLKGIDIPEDQVPLAIDEFPAIFVAAACAQGITRLRGAEELRVKESDRIQVMADGLTILGIKNQVLDDGIDIEGGKISGGLIESHGDHRIAMSFAMLALVAREKIRIKNCANVATSFPGFVELVKSVGLKISADQ